MKNELQEKAMENFDENNIENVSKLIEESIKETVGIFLDESGNGTNVEATEKSRTICASLLLK